MKLITTLSIFTVLFLFGCGVTDDPPSEEEVNQLDLRVEMSQGSEEPGITFMFSYSLPLQSDVTLDIADSDGNKVGRRIDTTQQPGNYSVSLDASTYPDGEYIYELLAEPLDGSENLRSTGSFVIER